MGKCGKKDELMRIELFYAPGCKECVTKKEGLKVAAKNLIPGLLWHEMNILDEIDYAVELGVLTLPAMAIDGEVVFSSLPTSGQLKRALIKRINKEA
jgi:thioredoxin 1